MVTAMLDAWAKLREVARRNRPSRKPQLWEDFPLALRRRIEFEVSRRVQADWLDRGHVVALSQMGSPLASAPLRIEVVPREMMNRALFLYGAYEISETRLVQALLGPGMTFVDIGANIGYYTLVAARMVGDQGRVHAFEPNRSMRDRLEANIHRNGLRNVVVHPDAVAQSTGQLEFFNSTWDANQGISSLLPGAGREEKQQVPSITLDDFVAGLADRRVDLIKMDIEGAEPLAIEGGRRTLGAADAPGLIFEAADFPRVGDPLRALGFKIRRLHYTLEGGLELPDADAHLESLFESYEAPNYFAAKADAVFDEALSRANAMRSPLLQLIGRI
jgi:FkbM family methyltransferase